MEHPAWDPANWDPRCVPGGIPPGIMAVAYQRIEERQNFNNSCYQKFDKEGSDLNSALSLVEFFKAKQGQNVPKRD